MSFEAAFAIGAGLAAALGLLLGWWLTRPGSSVPRRANYADRMVAVWLGRVACGSAYFGFLLGAWAVRLPEEAHALSAIPWGFLGLLLVGILDDRAEAGPRGFGGHLRALAKGRFTTGILKLLAGVGAALWAGLEMGGGPVRVAAALVLVAVSSNLFNALDVRPGRALKWAIPLLAAPLPALWGQWQALFLGAVAAACLGVLALDLRERGMLGDAGSNPLGFAVGVGLALALPTPWLIVAAGAVLALQVAAETVTISRLIEAVPPLRWFDRLGGRA